MVLLFLMTLFFVDLKGGVPLAIRLWFLVGWRSMGRRGDDGRRGTKPPNPATQRAQPRNRTAKSERGHEPTQPTHPHKANPQAEPRRDEADGRGTHTRHATQTQTHTTPRPQTTTAQRPRKDPFKFRLQGQPSVLKMSPGAVCPLAKRAINNSEKES